MRSLILVLILIASSTATVISQTRLGGSVADKQNRLPVAYATITLINQVTGKITEGALTDTTGHFLIPDVPEGLYIVTAGFLGYEQARTDSISIVASGSPYLLPVIMLTPARQILESVTITAQAPVVENKPDRVVYNLASDLTTQGGVALDVLKKVPQVSVDAAGNVELQGNPDIRFLINGKPSALLSSSLTDALSSIPASQIKSIEAITSPGAKYDAQGTGGIINIILNDNKMKGINGSINLSAGNRLENAALNLNIRKGNLAINAFVNGNAQLNSRGTSYQDRQSYTETGGMATRLLQDGYADKLRKSYQAGIGLDWRFSSKEMFSGTFQYSHFSNRTEGYTHQQQIITDTEGNPLSDQYSVSNAETKFHNNVFDGSLGYKRKFRQEGRELEVLYATSIGRPSVQYGQEQRYPGENLPFSGNTGDNPGKDHQTNLSIDYVHPLRKNISLETGIKGTFQHISSTVSQNLYQPATGTYIYDPLQSYDLNYDMRVYAGYLAVTATAWNWLHIKAGVRTEHTDVRIEAQPAVIPAYTTLAPSLILSRDFRKGENLKLAYSRRLERPEYGELNPFLNRSDPYNITTGNPLLKPEIGNNMELGYSRTYDNGVNYYIALMERINTQDVKPFTAFYPDYLIGDSLYHNVSVTNRRNIGTEYNSGLILSGAVPLKDLSLRTNIMLIHKHIINNLDGANPVTNAFTVRMNLNASYRLPWGLAAEAFGNYRSGFTGIQGRVPQFITYTFAIRKQLLHRQASIGLTATNLFANSVQQVTTVHTAGYTSYMVRALPFRSVGITFNYRFGKLEFGQRQGKEQNDQHLPAEN